MGSFRFRKRFKLAPGIWINLNKRSVGVSGGVPGARVSVNSDGSSTKSIGVPGTGLYYRDQKGHGGAESSHAAEAQQQIDAPSSDPLSTGVAPMRSDDEQVAILDQQIRDFAKQGWRVDGRPTPYEVTLGRKRGLFGARDTIALWVEEDGRLIADLRQIKGGRVQTTRILGGD